MMKSLLATATLAATFAVAPAFAATIVLKNGEIPSNASVRMKVTLAASGVTKYKASSSTLFIATQTKGKASGSLTLTMEGQTQSQDIPAQESTSEGKGYLKILSNNMIEMQTEGEAVKLAAKITRGDDGQVALVQVSDKEFAKAAQALIASEGGKQIRELQNNPAMAKARIEVSSMTCTGNAGVLSCSQSLKAIFEAAQ